MAGTPTKLDEAVLAELADLRIQRRKLRENPLQDYKGNSYLWSDPAWRIHVLFQAAIRATFFGDTPRWQTASNGKHFIRFTEPQARRFLETWRALPSVVIIDDFARFSMAIDFNFVAPGGERTEVGALVYAAKYKDSADALKALCDIAAKTAAEIFVFAGVAHVVPVPPSRRKNANKVPAAVAKAIAEALSAQYSPEIAETVADRPSLKNVAKDAKAASLQETIAVQAPDLFEPVLLVDDHYQSGTTMNYLVRALEQEEAFLTVYGFACDKTLSNRDNQRVDDDDEGDQ